MDISEYLLHFPLVYESYGWKDTVTVMLNKVKFSSDFGPFQAGDYVHVLYLNYHERRFWANCLGRDVHYDIIPRLSAACGVPTTSLPQPTPVRG